MFGLEIASIQATREEDAIFDKMKDQKKRHELIAHLDFKIRKIKYVIDQGMSQEDFIQINCLLDGYFTLRRIIANMQ